MGEGDGRGEVRRKSGIRCRIFFPFFFLERRETNRRPSLFADLFTEELNASRLDSSCTTRSTSLRSKLYESF